MKRGMIKADKNVTKKTGGSVAKTLLKVAGVGLAAGVALIAATDKTMKTVFPQPEDTVGEDDCCDGEDCCCGGDFCCGDEEI